MGVVSKRDAFVSIDDFNGNEDLINANEDIVNANEINIEAMENDENKG